MFSPLATATAGFTIVGVPLEFVIFALTLLGVALFHHQTFWVALTGMTTVAVYKSAVTGFATAHGVATGAGGFAAHLGHEWVILTNLGCLLLGFAILARHFEDSKVPETLPRFLPDDWKGAFLMLAMVWVLSSFLDNIAGALIGGAMAHKLFKGKVHIGYLAAIVAASNAGGAFSVVGDTTTTMMWIAGASPLMVFKAVIASVVALFVCGIIAAKQQHAYCPIVADTEPGVVIDWRRIFVVGLMLVFAMATNICVNAFMPKQADGFPFIGVAVWLAVVVTIPVQRHPWHVVRESLKGTLFLLFLVTTASMMPVEQLPSPSWQTTFGLGAVSAVFDNIPLTAMAIKQDGYDWGFLAFAVGFGGSMVWFGSSAGVAISNMYPEARSVGRWLRQGWHVVLAYVVAFFVMLAILKWHPQSIKPHLRAEPHATAADPAAPNPR